MLPFISVVVPNMNGMEHLPECFASLAGARYPADRQEWIVSDNGSTDGSVEWLRQRYPQTRIVRNSGNIGFARGCNNGAAAATGQYVVFLNNDTRVDADWLDGLLAALARDPEAVCAASHMVTWDGKADDFSGASANLFGVGRQRTVAGWPDCPAGPAEGDPLLFACGGAMMIDTKVFRESGGFDPSFFIYFEDVDLGWRLWVLGHKVVYAANSLVYHKGGGTTGESRAPSHRRYLLFETNTLSAIFKNYSQPLLDSILPAALLLEMQRALLSSGDAINHEHYRLDGKLSDPLIDEQGIARIPPISVAHMLSLGRFVDRLPNLSAERRRIQAARRRDDSEILPLFGWPFQPQFAGPRYNNIVRRIASALDIYPAVTDAAPNRLLLLAPADPALAARATALADALGGEFHVALAQLNGSGWRVLRPEDGVVSVAAMAPDADLLIASGDTATEVARLSPHTPLAVDVATTIPATAAKGLRELVVKRAELVICANPEVAAAWRGAGAASVVVEELVGPAPAVGAALLQFCVYPMTTEANL